MASPPSQEVKEGIKSGRRPVDLLSSDLSAVARAHIKIVRRSMANGPFDRLLRLGQRTIGSTWIEECTKYIRHAHGIRIALAVGEFERPLPHEDVNPDAREDRVAADTAEADAALDRDEVSQIQSQVRGEN